MSIIDFFTDDETKLLGNDLFFRNKFLEFINKHKEYYILIWNYNTNYGFGRIDLGITDKRLKDIEESIIDFDDVLEIYANKNGLKYLPKIKGGIDKRYYFALLNSIEINRDWIYGKHELIIPNFETLYRSSRVKAKIMCELLTLFINNNVNVQFNQKIVKETKKIMGWRGKLKLFHEFKQEFIKWFVTTMLASIITWPIPLLLGWLILGKI